MSHINSVVQSELDRILALSSLNIDYYEPNQGLDHLTEMAAKIAGTEISMVNLIDTFTQWSVSSHGLAINQMAREDSVCQYTILQERGKEFLVSDLSKDSRFKDNFYVTGDPNLRFYLGLPLTTPEGYNLGALCVMDSSLMHLGEESKELLRLIGRQIVDRLMVNNLVTRLRDELKNAENNQKKLAHDIRGSLGGIIGLADLILDMEEKTEMKEHFNYVTLIKQSSKSLIDLTEDILQKDFDQTTQHISRLKENETNLISLKKKITHLLAPQLKVKNLNFSVTLGDNDLSLPFQKGYVMQILGNLISNSIKFTQPEGTIEAVIALEFKETDLWLNMVVRDSGIGMSSEKIAQIMNEGTSSNLGTQGEIGFGLGLTLVKQLVQARNGTIDVSSSPNEFTEFKISIKVN